MQTFPIFLKSQDQPVLVVGGGAAALSKVRLLLQAGAQITLVAPKAHPELRSWARDGRITWHNRKFHTGDLCDKRIVVVSTSSEDRDARIAGNARRLGALVNVVDRPALSDFTMPAIVERGPVTVAISTGGTAPVLAREVRGLIETALPQRLGDLARFIDGFRDAVKAVFTTATARRRFWDRFLTSPAADQVLAGDEAAARRDMLSLLNSDGAGTRATISLIDVSHAQADLLTRRDQRLLHQADLVVHDPAVPASIIDLARREAQREAAADDVRDHLASAARAGRHVVYLSAASETLDRLSLTGAGYVRTPSVATPAPHATARSA